MLPAAGNPIYYVEDMLGSSRVITQNNGTVCYDADFTPFGGERPYTNTCPQNYKFEGQERDTETGNDDFGARYYSNRLGRWLSSDWSAVPVAVPYANLTNPQTLNLYSMVADDPESFADLDGHAPISAMSPVPPVKCAMTACSYWETNYGVRDTAGGSMATLGPTEPGDLAQLQAQATQQQQAKAQSGLTVSVVSGQNPVTGLTSAEAGAGFTVLIQSGSNFAPGDLTVSADLHFSADRRVADGTSVLLGAAAENSQAKVGGEGTPKTVNSIVLDVRPFNQSGNFGGRISGRAGANSGVEPGYITFHVQDASGTTRNVQLNVDVVSKRVPGGLPLPSEAWVQRLTVPIPKP